MHGIVAEVNALAIEESSIKLRFSVSEEHVEIWVALPLHLEESMQTGGEVRVDVVAISDADVAQVIRKFAFGAIKLFDHIESVPDHISLKIFDILFFKECIKAVPQGLVHEVEGKESRVYLDGLLIAVPLVDLVKAHAIDHVHDHFLLHFSCKPSPILGHRRQIVE